jgi:uncharacterized protein YkwD
MPGSSPFLQPFPGPGVGGTTLPFAPAFHGTSFRGEEMVKSNGVGLVNDYRVSAGCTPLTWITEIADVAEAHSLDMVQRDVFDDTNPDGASPFDRLRAAGLTYSRGAENIAIGYGGADAVLDGWLDSPGHRANIENCELSEHGVGLFETRWTHLFRTP